MQKVRPLMHIRFSVLWRALLICTLLLGGVPLHYTHAADVPAPPRQDADIEPAAVDGPTARSAIFNGNNAYVEVSPTAALHPTDAITIEAWVWRDDASRCETVLGKDFQTSYWLGFCSGKIRFYRAGSGTNVDSTNGVPARRWVHVAVTYDGANVRFYIDGALDRTVAVTGALTSNSLALGIGADLGASFPDYYFKGLLDEVRLWNVARSQDEIQADLYTEVGLRSGLIGAWRLNGSPSDSRARFTSTARGDLDYRSNGVLPRQIVVRRNTTATMTVDGVCSVGEYGNAERVTIDHEIGPLPIVFAQYNNDSLYICMQGLPRGSRIDTHAAINIDRDFSRDSRAQPGDYRFRMDFDGTRTALQGNDGTGYDLFTPPVGSWDGATTDTEFDWTAEYRFSASLLGITTWTGQTIGVDFGHYRYNAITDEFHWPVDGSWNRPDRWAPMTFSASPSTTAPTYNFSGHVRRQRDNAGIENATVYLFASAPTGSSLAGTARTNASGAFNVSYQGFGAGLFILQEEDPRGMRSVSAAAGSDGVVINANAIRFDAAAGTYQPVTFVDTDARPVTRSFDRHYLIVYGGDVRESDLWPLVEQKRGQGYQIEIVNTSLIASTVSGRDLAEKIRNWLKDRWQTHAPAPVYALLVGRADVIPVRDVAWDSQDLPDPASPSFSPAWPTDWYYADLDSNWDKNNNGFYGEDLNCYWDFNADCPSDRNTLEGPYGGPGNEDNWIAEIAVGRLGVSTPAEVQAALRTAVNFERSGALDKRAAVIGGGLWGWDGRSWVTDEDGSNGRYVNGGQARSDGSLYYNWDGDRPFGLDTAAALAGQLEPVLTQHMTNTITLYESSNPHNDPNLSPTAATPDIALSHANMDDVWQNQRFGLFNVAGHGDQNGVWGQSWVNDWNDNKQIEQPSNPADCADGSCWDLSGWYSYIDSGVPAPGLPPVVFANACGTGGVSWNKITNADGSVLTTYGPRAIGGDMMSLGKSAAWLGSLAVVPVTGVDNAQTEFNRNLLQGRLLGDAAWKSFNVLATDSLDDIRTKTMTLFGDPAMSYWGNGVDALAPWSQDGRDWWASSATPYNGPTVGRVAWTLNNVSSPPTVNRDGNVVVGRFAQSAIVAADGSVVISNTHGAVPPFPDLNTSAAIGSDGVYFAEARSLHVLASDLQIRDVISLDAAATGAPRLGADGVVYVPTDQGMQRIVGRQVEMLGDAAVTGAPAYAPDGALLWTAAGAIVRHVVDRWGNDSLTQRPIGAGTLTAPVVTSQGIYVVGSSNGLLFTGATNPLGGGWSVNTGAAIVHKAAVGFDDTVYVGNNAGDVIALSTTGSEVWRATLGDPVAATPTTDGTQLFVAAGRYLYALDLVTGSQNWRLDLGGALNGRSQPVIGSGRMIYVTRADDVLVAVRPDAWLTVPSNVLVQAGIGQLSVSWRDNTLGESGFRIDACTLTGDCASTIEVAQNVESAVLTLDADLPYFVRVQALGDQNDVAAASVSAFAEVQSASEYAWSGPAQPFPALPNVPTILSVEATGSDSLRINWAFEGNQDALAGFRILRSDAAGGTYAEVAQVGGDQRSWINTGLSANTTYFYKVSSLNAAGNSSPAGPAQATTRSVALPAPTSFTAMLLGGQVQLTWQDNADGETGYIVERSVPGEALYTPIAVLAADAVHFSDDAELFAGLFEYRVKAVGATTESPYTETSVDLGAEVNLIFVPDLRK